MTTSYPRSLALPGSPVARRWHGVLAPAVELLFALAAAARTTLRPFGRGVVILAVSFSVSRKRR